MDVTSKIAAGAYSAENPLSDGVVLGSNADHVLYVKLTRGFAVRLVHLLPGTPDDRIKIQLSIHELEHHPDYEAISYVWGPTDKAEHWTTIDCNGRKLLITKSLCSAFVRARRQDSVRVVWADAICINQEDDDEKSHHVAFMNRIYQHASNVLVCMDGGDQQYAAHVKSLLIDHEQRKANYLTVHEMPIVRDETSFLRDARWSSFGKLMQNTWFGRAWVCQETGVARNTSVLWDDEEFDYRDIMHLARWVVRCAPHLQNSAGISILTIHADWSDWRPSQWQNHNKVEGYGLVDFLSHAKGLGCKDPRDHIYAFLGHPLLQKVENGQSEPLIKPDYKMDVLRIFHDFTVAILPQTGIKLFSAIEHDDVSLASGIPSWVVLWDMDIIQNSMGYYPSFYYRASGPEKEAQRLPEPIIESKACVVQGLRIDSIAKKCQFPKDDNCFEVETARKALASDTIMTSKLNECFCMIKEDGSPTEYAKKSDTTKEDALSLSLCTGLTDYLRAEDDVNEHRKRYKAFQTILHDVCNERQAYTTSEENLSNEDKADSYWYDLCLGCKGRCFFITVSGYYGLGPWIMQPEDECWILAGSRVPFVLRRTRDGEGHYRILGEAYLHGTMDSEFVNDHGPDLAWQSVVLV